MALAAGVSFNTAETEQGAKPTRSATVRKFADLFRSANMVSSLGMNVSLLIRQSDGRGAVCLVALTSQSTE
jgi:hypothetical protein